MRVMTSGGRALNALATILLICLGANCEAQMTTAQVDNARTGAYLNETTLTPQNVNAQRFGKLFTLKVDGDVYAQPLFVPGVEIPGKGKHDVIYIATEHDSVYAFDAYGNPSTPLWQVSFLTNGATTLEESDVRCFFIRPEVGITSTPVIDLKSGTLYVLARTKISHALSANEFHQHLHALAITNGAEKFGGPIEIHATVRGKRRWKQRRQCGIRTIAGESACCLVALAWSRVSVMGFFLRRGAISRLGDGLRCRNAEAEGGVQRLSGCR